MYMFLIVVCLISMYLSLQDSIELRKLKIRKVRKANPVDPKVRTDLKEKLEKSLAKRKAQMKEKEKKNEESN